MASDDGGPSPGPGAGGAGGAGAGAGAGAGVAGGPRVSSASGAPTLPASSSGADRRRRALDVVFRPSDIGDGSGYVLARFTRRKLLPVKCPVVIVAIGEPLLPSQHHCWLGKVFA